MNQDRFAGVGKQFRGMVKGRWGELTNNPLVVAAGTRDQLAGRTQERYGIYKEKAERWCCGATRRAKCNRNWDLSNR